MTRSERRIVVLAVVVAVLCVLALALLPAGAPEPGFAPSSTRIGSAICVTRDGSPCPNGVRP